jgi:hypothetical protein
MNTALANRGTLLSRVYTINNSLITNRHSYCEGVGRGGGVGRDLGMGLVRGVGVGRGVALGVGVGVAVGVGVGVGVPPPAGA